MGEGCEQTIAVHPGLFKKIGTVRPLLVVEGNQKVSQFNGLFRRGVGMKNRPFDYFLESQGLQRFRFIDLGDLGFQILFQFTKDLLRPGTALPKHRLGSIEKESHKEQVLRSQIFVVTLLGVCVGGV
jgi:hypothetical protein